MLKVGKESIAKGGEIRARPGLEEQEQQEMHRHEEDSDSRRNVFGVSVFKVLCMCSRLVVCV